MSASSWRGSRFVIGMYASLVCVAGVLGFLMGTMVSNLRPPAYLFLVEFPATPVGIAAYGALTVATVLGVPLALVAFVSSRTDEDPASDRGR